MIYFYHLILHIWIYAYIGCLKRFPAIIFWYTWSSYWLQLIGLICAWLFAKVLINLLKCSQQSFKLSSTLNWSLRNRAPVSVSDQIYTWHIYLFRSLIQRIPISAITHLTWIFSWFFTTATLYSNLMVITGMSKIFYKTLGNIYSTDLPGNALSTSYHTHS